ncbi:MAG: aspartate aminotransferase family protein [Lacipirellulaceae bacterium]
MQTATRSIRLVTTLPGPKSLALVARRHAATPAGLAHSTDIAVASAHGALVTDLDGNTLIDMAGGIGMLNVGHTPENVVEAIRDQAGKLIHSCFLVSTFEPYVELAELLNAAAPGDFAKKTILSNSGSEAVENAVNLARYYTGRPAVIAFDGAYHGRSQLAMSLTSKYALFKKGFGPFAPEVYRVATPNLYRKPAGLSDEAFVEWTIAEFDNALVARVDPSAVAAVIIEPIQGEAGFVPIPARFLAHLRKRCDEHGIVLIADEVQAGMGRTGPLYSIEHSGVVPDMVVTAKSLGAGTPIAAVTGRAEVMDSAHKGGVGGTYGGSPIACRAALEAVRTIQSPPFQRRVHEVGERLRLRLEEWKERFPLVGDVRGVGAMRLVEFVLDRQTKAPAPDQTLAIIRRAISGGLLLIRAGLYSNCIRLLPPIVITDDQLDEALDVLEAAIVEVDADHVAP